MYDFKKPRMQMATISGLINIIQDLNIEAISRDKAIVKLLELDISSNERKFTKGIVGLIKNLARTSIAEEMNESELVTR